jgi:hypothetical protein
VNTDASGYSFAGTSFECLASKASDLPNNINNFDKSSDIGEWQMTYISTQQGLTAKHSIDRFVAYYT